MKSVKQKPSCSKALCASEPCSTLEDLYNESYAIIDQAICCDENGYVNEAVNLYEQGMKLIEQACRLPDCDKNDKYKKMVTANEHIVCRLIHLNDHMNSSHKPAGKYKPLMLSVYSLRC